MFSQLASPGTRNAATATPCSPIRVLGQIPLMTRIVPELGSEIFPIALSERGRFTGARMQVFLGHLVDLSLNRFLQASAVLRAGKYVCGVALFHLIYLDLTLAFLRAHSGSVRSLFVKISAFF